MSEVPWGERVEEVPRRHRGDAAPGQASGASENSRSPPLQCLVSRFRPRCCLLRGQYAAADAFALLPHLTYDERGVAGVACPRQRLVTQPVPPVAPGPLGHTDSATKGRP